ncbi:hypothetical protein L6452_32992 [Arctium lappa]|uniref:Uncharacterized protein n=1 Tax=Arctium lappa TaxID=4217 RepID=A0ACB8Z723_ARCLA|nr:hypothetical protein L6452_32992 [Arctium lappa]
MLTTIKLDEVKPNSDYVLKITRFLEYSADERSFFSRHSVDEDMTIIEPSDVEVDEDREEEEEGEEEEENTEEEMASKKTFDLFFPLFCIVNLLTFLLFSGRSPAKPSTAAARRATQLELARKGREKGKATSIIGSGLPKKTRMTVPREPSSKGGDASKVATPEKTKTFEDVIVAIPISVVPPVVIVQDVSDATQVSSGTEQMTPTAASIPSSADKGKGPVEVTTVKFTLPSDFMADNVLDRANIFPHLGKYHLPTFRECFQGMSVDDIGSNVAGLTFMALQIALNHYAQMEKVRRLVPKALEKEKAALEREQAALAREKVAATRVESLSARLNDVLQVLEVARRKRSKLQTRLHQSCELLAGSRAELEKTQGSLTEKEKEVKDLKAREAELEAKVEELKEELMYVEAFT